MTLSNGTPPPPPVLSSATKAALRKLLPWPAVRKHTGAERKPNYRKIDETFVGHIHAIRLDRWFVSQSSVQRAYQDAEQARTYYRGLHRQLANLHQTLADYAIFDCFEPSNIYVPPLGQRVPNEFLLAWLPHLRDLTKTMAEETAKRIVQFNALLDAKRQPGEKRGDLTAGQARIVTSLAAVVLQYRGNIPKTSTAMVNLVRSVSSNELSEIGRDEDTSWITAARVRRAIELWLREMGKTE